VTAAASPFDREQGDRRRADADERGTVAPHFFVPPVQAEHVAVPGYRALDIFHRQCDVIDPLERKHALFPLANETVAV